MSKVRILAFAGSARKESFNRKLLQIAAHAVEAADAEVTIADMREYAMPLYDGDLEEQQGFPENVERFYQLMKAHDGFVISCPEYNSSITPLLKNTIDWTSRPREGDPRMAAFAGKTAALLAASPGGLGGIRGLPQVQGILQSIGVNVIPSVVSLPNAHSAFNEDGSLIDESILGRINEQAQMLVRITRSIVTSE